MGISRGDKVLYVIQKLLFFDEVAPSISIIAHSNLSAIFKKSVMKQFQKIAVQYLSAIELQKIS
jgi:hypothetical protein